MEEGGETAFPVADMKTFNETLSAACHDALLISTDVQILTLSLLAHAHTHARTHTKKKGERKNASEMSRREHY